MRLNEPSTVLQKEQDLNDTSSSKRKALRRGFAVFGGLAVLTAIEYIIAIGIVANFPLLAIIAILKTGLIAYYFMHIAHLWKGEVATH